jgi:MFS family permease
MLFSIPLAAFYPFTPTHLRHLGFDRTAAWMSVGQITEILAMLCLARLFQTLRLKWIFLGGLFVGVLRYALCAFDSKPTLLAGVALHGFSFTLVYVTAQIYLNERIDAAWRARAQALMSLLSSGVGNLAGYLATGAWFAACTTHEATRWSIFWGWLATVVAGVLVFFVYAYHGKSPGFRRTP